MHYLLFYELDAEYMVKRAPYRDQHLKQAWEACERGEMALGGAFANPPDTALLLFQGDSPGVAERFAKNDPYVLAGIVKKWYVREWTTVVGKDASKPVRPAAGA